VKASRLSLYAHAGSVMGTKKRVRSRVSCGPSRYFETSSMCPAPHLQSALCAWIDTRRAWRPEAPVRRTFKNHTTIL